MNYFITPKYGKGIPIFLDAELHETFDNKNPYRESDYEWRMNLYKPVDLPEELFLITSDRLYSFDCYYSFGGFIVSSDFLNLFDKYSIASYKKASLITINKKGITINSKKYHYIKFIDGIVDGVNLELSKFIRDKQGFIKKYNEVILNDKIPNDLFVLNDVILFERLFSSERFKNEASKIMFTLNFFPAKEAGIFKPS